MLVHSPSAYAAVSAPATEALTDAEAGVVVAAALVVDDDVEQAASRTVASAIATSDVRRVMVPLPYVLPGRNPSSGTDRACQRVSSGWRCTGTECSQQVVSLL